MLHQLGVGQGEALAHTARVTVQPSDARANGKAGTEPADATARIVRAGDPEYEEIQQEIRAKYGFVTHVTKLLGTLGGIVERNRIPYGDRGVVITLAPTSEPADDA